MFKGYERKNVQALEDLIRQREARKRKREGNFEM